MSGSGKSGFAGIFFALLVIFGTLLSLAFFLNASPSGGDHVYPASQPSYSAVPPTDPPGYDLIVHTGTGTYHLADCEYAASIPASYRLSVHATPDQMKAQGYTPCFYCKRSIQFYESHAALVAAASGAASNSDPTAKPSLKPTAKPTPRPTAKPTPRPTAAPTPRPTKTPKPSYNVQTYPFTAAAKTTYVANLSTRKFHKPTCSDIKRMKPSNRREYTATREEMLYMGYSPCGHCKP